MAGDSDERSELNASPADPALATTQPVREATSPDPRPGGPRVANQRVQAALAASTRTEATLSGLMRAVQEVTTGLTDAREDNSELAQVLATLRETLTANIEEKTSLEVQLASLTVERDHALREVEQARADAERDRAFLVEEQDRFLAALLEEHEEALISLKAERDDALARARARREATTAPVVKKTPNLPSDTLELQHELMVARESIEKLLGERQRWLETLRRLQTQRDEAQRALAGRVRQSATTEPSVPDRATPVYAIPADDKAPVEAAVSRPEETRQNAKRTNPMGRRRRAERNTPAVSDAARFDPESARREPVALPDEPQPGEDTANDAGVPGSSLSSPLKRKPDLALGSYALSSEDVETEQVETTRYIAPKRPAN